MWNYNLKQKHHSFHFTESSSLNSPAEESAAGDKDEDVDDAEGLQANKPDAELKKRQLVPRWPTRVFAIDCLMKIIAACDDDKTHFDLLGAKEKNKRDKCEWDLMISCVISVLYVVIQINQQVKLPVTSNEPTNQPTYQTTYVVWTSQLTSQTICDVMWTSQPVNPSNYLF